MRSGAQPGNKNAVKAKRWQKALERALARAANGTVDQGLDKVADQVVSLAIIGDKDCWKEIGERLDGKPVQGIEGEIDAKVVVQVLRFTDAGSPHPG